MDDDLITRIWNYQVSEIVGAMIVLLVFCSACVVGKQLEQQNRRGIFGTVSLMQLADGQIGFLAVFLNDYRADNGRFPTTLSQLGSDSPSYRTDKHQARSHTDPWGNELLYTGGDSDYTIMSIHQDASHRAETIRYLFSEQRISTLP